MVMIDPLSLVDSAQPIMSREREVEEPSFCEYCMVCDKLISEKVKGNVVPEPVVEEEKPKKPKKKTAGGKVYVSSLLSHRSLSLIIDQEPRWYDFDKDCQRHKSHTARIEAKHFFCQSFGSCRG